MKLTITSIELKSPFKFFALSAQALSILRQLKTTSCAGFRKKGIWTTHYTMTLWNNDDELRAFATSGAHLDSMRKASKIAKEICTLTIEMDRMPDWKKAIKMLQEEGKSYRY